MQEELIKNKKSQEKEREVEKPVNCIPPKREEGELSLKNG